MTPRLATALIFVVNGVMIGTWIAQIPAISGALGASKTEVGLVLLCSAAGALVAMPLTGQLLTHVSSRRVVTIAALLFPLLAPLPSLAPSLLTLAIVMVLFGAANGVLDVAMNAHGIAVERALGSPVMSSLHAGWSIGGLVGSASVGVATAAGISPTAEAVFVTVALVATAAIVSRRLGTGSIRAEGGARISLPSRAVLPLGLLAVTVALVEGGLGDWAGLYLGRDLGAEPGLAAAGFAAFALGMAAARLGGDALNHRLGAGQLLRAGMVLVIVVVSIMLLVAQPVVAIVGLVLAGAGVANALPLLFSAAGRVPPSGPSLSAVFTMGYTAFLAGPPIIGFIADQVGLPVALGSLVGCALLVAVMATRAPGIETMERR